MITLLLKGGMFIIPLALCSLVGLAIIVDRWLYLRSAGKEAEYLLQQIDVLAQSDEFDKIESLCQEHGGLLAGIFLSGIRKFRQLREDPNLDFVQQEISKMMEDASIANTNDLERRLPILATVGNVAPLFGFAGTVTGMIRAFGDIAATANPNAQVVAAGIEEALVTTATGLLIAIPAVIFYNYFANQIDTLNARTEETANNVLDGLVMSMVRQGRKARG